MIPLRIGRVVARLKTPAYLVTAASDIHYLTGFSLEGFWLLITREGGFAFASPLLAGHLRGVLDSINPNFALGSRNSSSDAGLFLPKKDSTVGNATLSLFSSKNSRPRSPRFSRPNAKVGINGNAPAINFKAAYSTTNEDGALHVSGMLRKGGDNLFALAVTSFTAAAKNTLWIDGG